MNLGIKLRLSFFAVAIGLVALAIGWAAETTWREARELRAKFSTAQVESFEIADHFQATILDLNGALRRYVTHKDVSDWNEFVRQSEELDHWIDDQSEKLKNQKNEHDLLDKVNAAYDVYRGHAHQLTNEDRRTSSLGPMLEDIDKAEAESKQLLGLGNQLSAAHREAVVGLISSTQKSLPLLQGLIFGLLIVLLALGFWLAVDVYREMIAPLRVKLVESRAIIERQEKLASLGVLAAGVAHEIRNPLTALKARLFMLQKALTPDSTAFDDASLIGDELNRLECIVRDVLEFGRPSDPNLVPMFSGTLLMEVHDLFSQQMEKREIQLKLEILNDDRIQADPQQLKQVLINLIQNAADSIDEKGTIILRSRSNVERIRGHASPVVILEVADTGKGIPLSVQKRIFDPFFTTKDSGTGLGLAIAARIVEKHGGILEFRTQLNHGTTFGILLPKVEQA